MCESESEILKLPNELIYNILKYIDNIDDIINLRKLYNKKIYDILNKSIKNINNSHSKYSSKDTIIPFKMIVNLNNICKIEGIIKLKTFSELSIISKLPKLKYANINIINNKNSNKKYFDKNIRNFICNYCNNRNFDNKIFLISYINNTKSYCYNITNNNPLLLINNKNKDNLTYTVDEIIDFLKYYRIYSPLYNFSLDWLFYVYYKRINDYTYNFIEKLSEYLKSIDELNTISCINYDIYNTIGYQIINELIYKIQKIEIKFNNQYMLFKTYNIKSSLNFKYLNIQISLLDTFMILNNFPNLENIYINTIDPKTNKEYKTTLYDILQIINYPKLKNIYIISTEKYIKNYKSNIPSSIPNSSKIKYRILK